MTKKRIPKKRAITDTLPATPDQAITGFLANDRIIIGLQVSIILVVMLDYLLNRYHFLNSNELAILTAVLSFIVVVTPRFAGRASINSLFAQVTLHLMLGIFLVYIVPVKSVYDSLIILVMYTVSYWYGTRGFVMSYLYFVGVLQLAYIHQNVNDLTSLRDLYLKFVLYGLIGALIDRLHSLDLREREELVEVSKAASYERERLRSLINSMGDAVIATDDRGKILVYNGAALALLNTNETIDGKPLSHYLRTYNESKEKVDLIAIAKKSDTFLKRDDILLKLNNNEFLNLYASVAEIHLSYGDTGEKGYILLLRDITREKSIEEQRDEFISVISHELRTPIAIAEANISTTMLPNVLKQPNKARDLLEQAHQNVLFLASLVNDITTLTHAERGDLEAKLEDVDPRILVEDLADNFTKEAKAKGLKLKTEIAKNIPHIRSNTYRLNEILHNFLTNAIKYTENGTVTIAVAVTSDNQVRFDVKDTGIGMNSSDLRHVFEKFWRSEDYRTRVHNGTGLGLYISKKLAERMHGTISVSSRINKGSTFSLTVPLSIE